MEKTTAKKIKKWIKITIIIYAVCGAALYFFQEKILFHPIPLQENYHFHFPNSFTEINVPVNAQKNLSIVQFNVPDSVCKGVVLYFHGNRRNIERYAPFAVNFTRNNYSVWMMDYPGFGKTTGKRTEQTIYGDAAILYEIARSKFSKDKIIIYGKSIGTGIASQLASVKDCKRVILETPYYSIDALMTHYAFIYPVGWLTKYHFPTYTYFKKIESPITLFHGTDDEVIPYQQAVHLAKENPGVELVTIENGKHNNLNDSPVFQERLNSLLQLP